jgi:hypothetical protein
MTRDRAQDTQPARAEEVENPLARDRVIFDLAEAFDAVIVTPQEKPGALGAQPVGDDWRLPLKAGVQLAEVVECECEGDCRGDAVDFYVEVSGELPSQQRALLHKDMPTSRNVQRVTDEGMVLRDPAVGIGLGPVPTQKRAFIHAQNRVS